ncbi:MAG: hypothetical protein A3G33_07170 [Omnitrophica bacterium RIFCSPLOWO2_12_FULL_44_17]|uniref:Major facilitator superfamily (MFS) profile domain-containing protein n=1 Tax=Candidatus Danuiimicrobium aquiferis TaxID=1801832 RepID=A0A1G1KYM1_9BACT|nr:MAG: hypothetical protein A3B72_07465 [Omnitrophica bacterium RIFCSPHIGHO2_02_FULL_45_28]OGW90387.1 MAG: hypothetical protein A3E74_07205 [Omnitrophica bacterium RIFCSPHIGHO2_12_FULL_44_12]OGW98008.1 MAG: hypothetical protein A3G33_07170 [Omnitrophica bacterium RIFCSPLOWO2_12_FULL_44_17]OGX03547.1 MAG: hypothetical protein A3J12_03060 [Omnitrophica bacterium RIFCSPLOWO2_02_FULL_44_11]
MKERINKNVGSLAFVVYFIQGALGLSAIALPLFMRENGYSISKIAWITSLTTWPWFVKILYGIISDGIPIFGLRRKPYLIICSLFSAAGWFLLAVGQAQDVTVIFALTLANLGLAATDVITDGLVVEYSDKSTAQTYQSISWGARSIGALLAGVTGGYLTVKVGYRTVFLLTGFLPMISFVVSFFIHEQPSDARSRKEKIAEAVFTSFKYLFQRKILWFMLLFAVSALPVAIGTPFFFYMKDQLRFNEFFLGLLQSLTWLGAIIGCLFYARFFKTMKDQTALYWAVMITFVDVLLVFAIRGRVSAGVLSVIGGILGYISLLPFMSLAAKLSHGTGVEGSLFAMISSIYNLSQAIFRSAGGMLYEGIGLNWLILATAFLSLTGFWFIRKLSKNMSPNPTFSSIL